MAAAFGLLLRRRGVVALSPKKNLLLIQTTRHLSSSSSSPPIILFSQPQLVSSHPPPASHAFFTRRGFAKGKKSSSRNEDGGGGSSSSTIQAVPDIGPTVKSTALSQMESGIVSLSRELTKLRTGRASAGILDHILVEIDGVKMPLNRMAVVSVLDAQTLSVTPFDPNALKAFQSAIVSSPLGLNPRVDGQRLIAPIPPLTKENVQALCKVVAKSAEDVKQSIRRARQKALDSIKKAASSIPKDDVKRLEKEVEEMTKKFVKSADDMCKAKEKEIAGSGR